MKCFLSCGNAQVTVSSSLSPVPGSVASSFHDVYRQLGMTKQSRRTDHVLALSQHTTKRFSQGRGAVILQHCSLQASRNMNTTTESSTIENRNRHIENKLRQLDRRARAKRSRTQGFHSRSTDRLNTIPVSRSTSLHQCIVRILGDSFTGHRHSKGQKFFMAMKSCQDAMLLE